VSSGRIIDHQITGKEKLAVARTKDRSLDSLTASRDKRIKSNLEQFVGNWPTIQESKDLHHSLQRKKQEKIKLTEDQKKLESLKKRLIDLLRLYERNMIKKISKGKIWHTLNRIDKQIVIVKEQIQRAEQRIKDDKHV
jgi:hypothetical protein